MEPEFDREMDGQTEFQSWQEFEQEIELLRKSNFSRDSGAQRRIRRRLERKWNEQSYWNRLWQSVVFTLHSRTAIASSALFLFLILNLRGVFSLPQHAIHLTPIPGIPALRVQLPEITAVDGAVASKRGADPLLATTTPQKLPREQRVLVPTPMPVPAPLVEG